MTNQRPTAIPYGYLREYFTGDNRYRIDEYRNGEWVNIVDEPLLGELKSAEVLK